MRPWLSFPCLFLVLLNPPNLIADDPPAPWNENPAWPMESRTVVPPSPTFIAPLRAVGPQPFDVEVLLGLPTELRFQWAVARSTSVAFMLEGIAGAEILPFDTAGGFRLGVFGIGGRLRGAVYNGERNAFVIKPGADVYAFVRGNRGYPLGGADVEFLWWHNFGQQNRFGFELGADIGSFLIFDSVGFGWLPMVSGVVGFHF